ncbi:fibronectin type III domain-containing protein [Pedosphaera parvula]|uniref:Fibronectin type III domain protein n=1 Tax=Pedosphaera parvula (strain Ellin514) TaxID=320771 RepID=B9XD54_PEDPL|nr:fibronectin type III domain-containing protein [Pedosphaera parvula]EEF62400.1 Fibronectin type III domain protein [Pedosphaera parvula Ellin514]
MNNPNDKVCAIYHSDRFTSKVSIPRIILRNRWKVRLGLFSILLFLAGFPICSRAEQSVSLAWDPSPDPTVAGYFVRYGTTSGVYPFQVDAKTLASATVSGLKEGLTYYFVVIAYNASGVESVPSNELAFLVPGALVLTSGVNPSDPIYIKFPVAPTHWYALEGSSNLATWNTIWQTAPATSNDWVQFTDMRTFSNRFYRLILH